MEAYDEQDLPWYLRYTPFFIISLLFAPAALIILFMERKKLYREIMSDRLFISGLFMLFFMLKILPKNIYTIIISVLLYIFTGLLLVIKLIITNKKSRNPL